MVFYDLETASILSYLYNQSMKIRFVPLCF